MARGAFIVLEGLDRAGKSTQVNLLLNALMERKITAEKRNFPGNFFFYNLKISKLKIFILAIYMESKLSVKF